MIDTHAHLDAFADASSVLERARQAGVTRVVSVGTSLESARAVLALCEEEEGVFAALGLHLLPNPVDHYNKRLLPLGTNRGTPTPPCDPASYGFEPQARTPVERGNILDFPFDGAGSQAPVLLVRFVSPG